MSDWSSDVCSSDLIAGVRENRALMERAFDEIDAALADGGIADIFPEGRLTTDGEIAAFKSGVERILARAADAGRPVPVVPMALRGMWASRSEEHTSELQSLMRISYAVFCLKKKKHTR